MSSQATSQPDSESLAFSFLEEKLPPIPTLGGPEIYYASRARQARRDGDTHGMRAYKVAQYVTAAQGKELSWEEKLRHFEHALNRHCEPPPFADDAVWSFYAELAQLVREHAAIEAFAIARRMDEIYAQRLNLGTPWRGIERTAEHFFAKLVPSQRCPRWFREEDYRQLVILRNYWVRTPLPARNDGQSCGHVLAA